jgi:hypothetical protein
MPALPLKKMTASGKHFIFEIVRCRFFYGSFSLVSSPAVTGRAGYQAVSPVPEMDILITAGRQPAPALKIMLQKKSCYGV